MSVLKKLAVVAVLVVCVITFAMVWLIKYQGLDQQDYEAYSGAKIVFDEKGIPTIEASTWEGLIRAQGYVVASERLWQMELSRRYASGRLSEVFGKKAAHRDRRKIREDWLGVAQRAVVGLPREDREFCDAYAAGVNQFIEENEGSLGLEFSLLRHAPEPWSCADSVLVLMSMTEYLNGQSARELERAPWRNHLTAEWQSFLFPATHPWANPMFGRIKRRSAPIPPDWQALPTGEVIIPDQAALSIDWETNVGSNAWAWTTKEATYLSGDPHLARGVPQTWYALRLRIDVSQWVVGATLPGIPGVLIGMNPFFAWTFTNLQEDVDDFLVERVNESSGEYLAFSKDGRSFWERLVVKRRTLKIKGEDDEEVLVQLTHRGPVLPMTLEGEKVWLSRQWLAHKEGSIGMNVVALNRATDFVQFNEALDKTLVPSLNVVFADRQGQVGYRAMGATIERRVSGVEIHTGREGEWLGWNGGKARRRVLKKPTAKPQIIVNANQQTWPTTYQQHWASDDRADRIASVLLDDSREMRQTLMTNLQLDTHSRFHIEFKKWLEDTGGGPKDPARKRRWLAWDGHASSDEKTFSELEHLEMVMTRALIERVRKHFLPDVKTLKPYGHKLRRAWLLRCFRYKRALRVFGVESEDLAGALIASIEKDGVEVPSYRGTLAQAKQHPFVDRIPVIGRLFRVRPYLRDGHRHAVRAETVRATASLRTTFNLREPLRSVWSFPTGQSGHVRSTHYRDLQEDWLAGRSWPIFDRRFRWIDGGQRPVSQPRNTQ